MSVFSGKQITRVCLGAEHSIAVDSQGLLWGWGRNDFLQLGFQSLAVKEDDNSKSKWGAHRTVTISKGPDKPARTFQLPQDSKYFVQKPQRISGLRANMSDQQVEINDVLQRAVHTFTPESLVDAIKKWAGSYDVDSLVRFCIQQDLNELGCFVQAVNGRVLEAFQTHLQWLTTEISANVSDMISWNERLMKTLTYYKTSFFQLDLYASFLPDAVERLCQLALDIRRMIATDSPELFDLESFIEQDDVDFWSYGVYCCLNKTDSIW